VAVKKTETLCGLGSALSGLIPPQTIMHIVTSC